MHDWHTAYGVGLVALHDCTGRDVELHKSDLPFGHRPRIGTRYSFEPIKQPEGNLRAVRPIPLVK